LREHVTVHGATHATIATTIGKRALMMVNSHMGHDARIGDDVVMVNNSALGGHSSVDDSATMGGGAMLHQFTRVGRLAFVGGATRVTADVPPFTSVVERSRLTGVNLVGLRRAGTLRDDITKLREAFRKSFRVPMTRLDMVETLRRLGQQCRLVEEMANFVGSCSHRPVSVGYERAEHEAREHS
jgi:UDP-N-acetylglucosamine acyltransferase